MLVGQLPHLQCLPNSKITYLIRTRGPPALVLLQRIKETTLGKTVSSTALFLRVKPEDQIAPCQGRQRTEIHRGFQAARPTSVLVPLDDYSSVSLSFREPDSTVRARSLLHFHFLCTTAENVTALLRNRGMESGIGTNHSFCSLTQHGCMILNFSFY